MAMYSVITTDGKSYGPVDEQGLLAWVKAGRVGADTSIHNQESNQMVRACTLPFLAGEFAALPPVAYGVAPMPTAHVSANATSLPYIESKAPGIITTPLLISAIWNCLAALVWVCTCFGAIFAAPLVVLLIFEFMLYADLNNAGKVVSPSKVKTIAICEIVAGLVSLTPLVCGIIILTNLGQLDINKGKVPR